MQFFHLFSFVVVASYAAALPQPAGLSEKYSNNVDTNLTILRNRSEDNSEDDYEDESPLEEAESDLWALSSIIDQATPYISGVPANVKAAGEAVGGDAEKALVEYFERALHNTANVESSLKEAKDKLTADVSDNLQQVNAALSVIAETPSSAKQGMETVHAALGRVFDAYKVYFEVLKSQMGRVEDSEAIQEHFSEASASFVTFASRRQDFYDEVTQKLEAAPSE
ncbi:hypothetical protein BASA81_014399 [Batrachochytrium salamandrivorans]|nr:hypothetical protein BASA81_014399 [Batrachochytrium salamandrivorans]